MAKVRGALFSMAASGSLGDTVGKKLTLKVLEIEVLMKFDAYLPRLWLNLNSGNLQGLEMRNFYGEQSPHFLNRRFRRIPQLQKAFLMINMLAIFRRTTSGQPYSGCALRQGLADLHPDQAFGTSSRGIILRSFPPQYQQRGPPKKWSFLYTKGDILPLCFTPIDDKLVETIGGIREFQDPGPANRYNFI